MTTSKQKSNTRKSKQSNAGKKAAKKGSTNRKPAGKQPPEQKDQVFEPGVEG
jgi:hypothetical protein